MKCVSYHCFEISNGVQCHSKDFTNLLIFAVAKVWEKSLTDALHHSQATFGSGNPRRNVDITCQPLPDMGQSQIIGLFGISHNLLGIIYFKGANNNFRPETHVCIAECPRRPRSDLTPAQSQPIVQCCSKRFRRNNVNKYSHSQWRHHGGDSKRALLKWLIKQKP